MTEPEIQPSRRRYQFSLRAILIVVTVLALLLAIAVQFPRQSGFLALMTSLVLFPLGLAAAMRVVVVRMRLIGESWPWRLPGARQGGILAWPGGVLRWLGLSHVDDGPSLAGGAIVAILSTLVVVGLWPLLREVGLQFAVTTTQPEVYNLADAAHSILDCATSSRYWVRLWQWELWSLGRWWFLFGGITALWLAARAPFSWRTKSDHPASVVARFLAFAPWLIVLEVTFLVGVWISSPATVPEPSTGFVVGIFSWDLWHWNCWLDREWLVRGAVPTLIAGSVFFARVLRWPWPAAVIAAVGLIPVALLLSVACTVAWQHGLPWLGQ